MCIRDRLHTSHRVASYISRTLDDIVTQPGAQASLKGLEYYDEQPTGVFDSLEHAYDALAKEVQVRRFVVSVSHHANTRTLARGTLSFAALGVRKESPNRRLHAYGVLCVSLDTIETNTSSIIYVLCMRARARAEAPYQIARCSLVLFPV